MRIRYNAPVTLTFALVSTLILAADQTLRTDIIPTLFTMPPRAYFSLGSPADWIRLFTHIAGHGDWAHLLGNFAFILLLGPILEEKYGAVSVLVMMLITSLVTGLLNGFFSEAALLGASGVVFMMILLASFTNIKNREVPLTFLLVVALYLAREIISAFNTGDQIAQFAHIAGGVCGSLFGFLKPSKR
jgi:rhomboid protease GluP